MHLVDTYGHEQTNDAFRQDHSPGRCQRHVLLITRSSVQCCCAGVEGSNVIFSHRYIIGYCSPVATGSFGGLSPPTQSTKPPKLKHETLNQ